MTNLEQKIEFLKGIAPLGAVERMIASTNPERMESSSEHTFSCWWMARVLKNEIESDYPGIDFPKLLDMIMVHDVPEVYAGDVSIFDDEGRKLKHERELKAAKRIFPILPDKEAAYFFGLWQEYEAGETQEAVVAKQIDHLDPMIQNMVTNGTDWRREGITAQMIDDKKLHLFQGEDVLSRLYRDIMEEVRRNNITGEYSP